MPKEEKTEFDEWIEKDANDLKDAAGGKSSKDCTHEEACQVYRSMIQPNETPKQRLDRINRFRCGW